MKLTAPAPGKVNLSLLVGAPRADGLHPLVSVVQAVSLADELTLEPATGDADEVVCPGVEGPNLAARALELFREATGWDAPPQRIHIDKRVPVAAGMGGGSADAAAALRLAAHAAGGAPAGLLHELAVRLGADVPSQLEPGRVLMTGAGERVDRLPDPEPFGLVIVPLPHALSTPDVYAAFDRLSTPRTPDELHRARAAALAGEPPPPVNDLQDAARELCPAIDDALFGGAMVSGSGPTVFATYPTIEAARRGGAGDPRRDRRPPGAPRLRGGGGRVKWSWLLGAAALAAFLIVRRRSLGRLTQAAGWIVAAAAGLVGFGVIQLPNLEELMLDVGRALGPWTYLVVGVLAFLETGAFIGLVAPGETTVIVGGVVAGQGEISLSVLIAITWTCAVAGDLASYTAGRKLGRAWLLRHGQRVKITEERLEQVERFFEKRGGVTILVGRFIGFVRALAPFIAGTSRMPLRRFLPYDVLGAGAWAATFATLGYVFWHSFDQLTTYVSRGLFAFATVVVVIAAIATLIQLRRDPAKRERVRAWLEEREDRRGWRPIVRLAGPVWRVVGRPAASGADVATRFGAGRLTPGGLGLELTTLLALGAVGTYAFFFIGSIATQPGLPQIDEMASDLALELAVSPLIDVAKVVTEIGSFPVVAAAALATATWAATQRRWIDAGALVVGTTLSWVLVHVAKAAYDRDRPPGGLVDVANAAYPSGHTAYAVALVACAAVLVRAGSGWAVRFAAVTVAVVLVAVVGVTRVYLRVHYLTDVLGGVALGVAIWSIIGTLALVAGYVRHNDRVA